MRFAQTQRRGGPVGKVWYRHRSRRNPTIPSRRTSRSSGFSGHRSANLVSCAHPRDRPKCTCLGRAVSGIPQRECTDARLKPGVPAHGLRAGTYRCKVQEAVRGEDRRRMPPLPARGAEQKLQWQYKAWGRTAWSQRLGHSLLGRQWFPWQTRYPQKMRYSIGAPASTWGCSNMYRYKVTTARVGTSHTQRCSARSLTPVITRVEPVRAKDELQSKPPSVAPQRSRSFPTPTATK